MIPTLSEIMDSYKTQYKLKEENTLLNDKSSGLYNSALSIGAMVGPVIGGILNDEFGYIFTTDLMALSCAIYSLIYLTFNMQKSDFTWTSRSSQE